MAAWRDGTRSVKLRRANIDGAAGAVEDIERIIGWIRARWPRTKIILRADSGLVLRTPFGHARDALMVWCESNRVRYVLGLAQNVRLLEQLTIDLAWAAAEHEHTGQPARRFQGFPVPHPEQLEPRSAGHW